MYVEYYFSSEREMCYFSSTREICVFVLKCNLCVTEGARVAGRHPTRRGGRERAGQAPFRHRAASATAAQAATPQPGLRQHRGISTFHSIEDYFIIESIDYFSSLSSQHVTHTEKVFHVYSIVL